MKGLRQSTPTATDNLGPTLLLATGIATLPAGIGLGLILIGLSALREANGDQCFPRLHRWIKNLQNVQFWRMTRL